MSNNYNGSNYSGNYSGNRSYNGNRHGNGGRGGRDYEVEFNILENIGILDTYKNDWSKEINVVSWNNNPPKFDIRDWDPAHERMSRGVTLTGKEAENLAKTLARKFGNGRDGRVPYEKESSQGQDVVQLWERENTGLSGDASAYRAGAQAETQARYEQYTAVTSEAAPWEDYSAGEAAKQSDSDCSAGNESGETQSEVSANYEFSEGGDDRAEDKVAENIPGYDAGRLY